MLPLANPANDLPKTSLGLSGAKHKAGKDVKKKTGSLHWHKSKVTGLGSGWEAAQRNFKDSLQSFHLSSKR
jgi:hypothetical protein